MANAKNNWFGSGINNVPKVLREREHGPIVADGAVVRVLGVGKHTVTDECSSVNDILTSHPGHGSRLKYAESKRNKPGCNQTAEMFAHVRGSVPSRTGMDHITGLGIGALTAVWEARGKQCKCIPRISTMRTYDCSWT